MELRITVTPAQHHMLYANAASAELLTMQPDRFVAVDPGSLLGLEFFHGSKGTLYWCETGAAALLLLAYEDQAGYDVSLASDEAVARDWPYPYVVVSSQRFGPDKGEADPLGPPNPAGVPVPGFEALTDG